MFSAIHLDAQNLLLFVSQVILSILFLLEPKITPTNFVIPNFIEKCLYTDGNTAGRIKASEDQLADSYKDRTVVMG